MSEVGARVRCGLDGSELVVVVVVVWPVRCGVLLIVVVSVWSVAEIREVVLWMAEPIAVVWPVVGVVAAGTLVDVLVVR